MVDCENQLSKSQGFGGKVFRFLGFLIFFKALKGFKKVLLYKEDRTQILWPRKNIQYRYTILYAIVLIEWMT